MRTIEEIAIEAAERRPVTQEEAESLVRSITRTCRGKPIIPLKAMRVFHAKWEDTAATGDWDKSLEACEEFEHAAGVQGQEIDRGDWEGLGRRALTAIFAHGDTVGKPCGADFNDQICAAPFDGQMRKGKCPNCGAEHVFTSPVFVIAE